MPVGGGGGGLLSSSSIPRVAAGDKWRTAGDHERLQRPVPAHRFWPGIRNVVLYQGHKDPSKLRLLGE